MLEQFVDSHCHLNFSPLASNIASVLNRAKARGVSKIVVPAYDSASWQPIVALERAYENVYSAIGIHPWVADKPMSAEALKHTLRNSSAVAVGEIGLDFKVDVPKKQQIDVFERQLSVAQEFDLPVILHVRGAFEEMLSILEAQSKKIKGVVHAFSRGPQLAERFAALGLHIAFGGAVTHQRAKRARRAAATLPLDTVLIETDAPSIGLDGVLPIEVEPAHTADVAAALAAIRQVSIETIAEVTTHNATELFNL